MYCMFSYCFQNNATLICKASTIKNITDDWNSCLIIENKENENNDEIKNTLTNEDNQDTVYTCNIEIVAESKEEEEEEKKEDKKEEINTNKKEKKQEEVGEEEYVKHKITGIEKFIKEE